MAYYATQEGGNYAVFQDGKRVSTTSSAGLVGFGLSSTSLGTAGGAAPAQTPTQTQTVAPTQAIPNPPTTAQTNTTQSVQVPPPDPATSNSAGPPSTNLQPGSTGQDVAALQNYLVQMGYLTPDQLSGGQGTYGPKTTAAVAQLQQQLGIQAGSGAGYYGPQTQSALAQKYNQLHQQLSVSQSVDQAGQAKQQIQNLAQAQQPTDPFLGAVQEQMAPIMQSLVQVMSNINNPALTGVSLQQEYNQLATQNGIPQMQSELLNWNNIMNGSEDDIRNEVTSAGGFATDSQVLAMSAARNKVILKQYNAVSSQYTAATQNVQNMMQYASTDQQTQLQKQQITASVSESLASIESQMMTMGNTMQQNAKQAVQYNVTQTGYTGLAASAQNNPQVLGYYEQMLNLAPGTLSDPKSLQALDTYKQQQIAISEQNAQNAAQRTVVYAYNAGYGLGGVQPQITPNPTGGPSITQPYTASQLVRPQGLPQSIPLTMSGAQMKQYMGASSASVDPGTSNVVAPGIGYYVEQSDGSYALNSAIPKQTATNSIDSQYQGMLSSMQTAQKTPVTGSPLNKGRLSRNANTALKNYVGSTVYQQVSNAVSYLARVKAAMSNPGSISDTELADAIIKINTGGGQVTEAQIGTYFQGQSYADKFAIQGDKITEKGGVLSPQQRKDLSSLAQETFTNYETQYEQLYVQAGQNLLGQGIPLNYLANIPDFTQLLQGQSASVQ